MVNVVVLNVVAPWSPAQADFIVHGRNPVILFYSLFQDRDESGTLVSRL